MRALKHRNFQLFFGGQLVSVTGTWMQTVALSWLVYRLNGSTLQMVSSNTLIQTMAPEHLRGRVMSVHSMRFMGMVPFGALMVGRWLTGLGAPRVDSESLSGSQ